MPEKNDIGLFSTSFDIIFQNSLSERFGTPPNRFRKD